jgi:hypothetical protein
MNRTHPIDAAAIGAVGLVRLARAVLVPCVALVLTVVGWRPAGVAAAAPVALAAEPAPAPASLTVMQLRQMARAAGHRALGRSGRRTELLAVLALA